MKIATAESCTGGMIAARITSVSGSSGCFDCGLVTYSNYQKHKLLGVRRGTLKKYGAVSRETALEMCKGARRVTNADIAVSVTGIAGPTGGSEEKPVGTVWIGVCCSNIHKAKKYLFDGDRNSVREQTVETALKIVNDLILGKDF
jgi:nicotinamide-nucleotide amidase